MEVQTIIDYIIVIAPTIASMLGVIVGFIKIVKSAKENSVNFTEAVDDINKQLKVEIETRVSDNAKLESALTAVLDENAELKRQNTELKTLITGVKEV